MSLAPAIAFRRRRAFKRAGLSLWQIQASPVLFTKGRWEHEIHERDCGRDNRGLSNRLPRGMGVLHLPRGWHAHRGCGFYSRGGSVHPWVHGVPGQMMSRDNPVPRKNSQLSRVSTRVTDMRANGSFFLFISLNFPSSKTACPKNCKRFFLYHLYTFFLWPTIKNTALSCLITKNTRYLLVIRKENTPLSSLFLFICNRESVQSCIKISSCLVNNSCISCGSLSKVLTNSFVFSIFMILLCYGSIVGFVNLLRIFVLI